MNPRTKWLSLALAGGAILLAGTTPASAGETVADLLKGKLVSLNDNKSAAHELKGEPEFYVLYHSASW